MAHYKNGRECKVGDRVIGTTYNSKGVQVGILVGFTPESNTCNARVSILNYHDSPSARSGQMTMIHRETLANGNVYDTVVWPTVDYTQCDYLLHAEDALKASFEYFKI